MPTDRKTRCAWPIGDERMLRYHDKEWGVPVHDDRKWFELIVLDAFQAGLSWRTILHKREAFRQVFHGFDPAKVARMPAAELRAARRNPGIVRNRMKIQAAVRNAKAFLSLQKRRGSFDAFIWSFTNGKTIRNSWSELRQLPARTPLSDAVSEGLKAEGFSFVGSTICYAFLQAGGIVNDHIIRCFRHREVTQCAGKRAFSAGRGPRKKKNTTR